MLLVSEQEILERRKAEAALSSSEGRYQRLFENSEMSIWNEDMSEVFKELARLRDEGVTNLRPYLESNLQVAWDIASKVKVAHVNEATLKLFDAKNEDEFIYQIDKTFGPEAINVFIDELCAIWDKRSFFRAEASYRTIDGRHLDCIISFLIPDTAEGFNSIPVTILDITERKQAEESLRVSESRYRGLINNIPDLVYRTDTNNRISYVSPSVYTLTGYTVDEYTGINLLEKVYVDPDKRGIMLSELEQNGQVSNFEVQQIRKNGSIWWASINAHLMKADDGRILGVEGTVRDISEQKSVEEQLSYQASHDILTGLINRHEFENRTSRLLSRIQHDRTEHAMCFMDLDQFKVVNDTCGHVAGDELLRQLGKLLQNTVSKRDTLARLGGDEFGVLMERCSLEQAHRVGDEILKAVKNYQFFWEGEAFRIGISIGLTAITEATGNFTELFKQADVACYLAKDLGRNRIHTYLPEDTELAIRHGEMQWVGRISQALDDNRFCLYAQPIVSLDSGAIKHYELLIRMLDEQGGTIPPGAFLPAAERYNLIEKLDAWVVNHACAFLADQPDFVEQVDFISINLSGPSLVNKDLLETIMQNFRESRVSPNKICFEITETVAISNLESATSFISILKMLGCRFALDDFGSGLSSFGYLKNLPVDYLKIDGIFVKDIVDDPIDHAMVKSINDIGQVMGMQTIAEFVENDKIIAMLKGLGVNYGQGYGLGKPEPLKDLVSA
ncbi:MAG: EAL domain-containing protein [Gammaproteobacteria bacterium]|nr:EAL domain-containing protein [Gammaproteobacteria bacterium]